MSLSLKTTTISTDLKYSQSSFTSSKIDEMHSNLSWKTATSFETRSKFFSLNEGGLSSLPACSINTTSSLLAKDVTSLRVPLSSLNLKCSLLDTSLNRTNFFGHTLDTEKKKSKSLLDTNKSIKRKQTSLDIESKKSKVKNDEAELKDQIEEPMCHTDEPAYTYEFEKVDVEKIKEFGFSGIKIIKEWKIHNHPCDDHSPHKLKKDLLDAVSTCLVQPFNLQNTSHIESFVSKIEAVSHVDPEFVLKLALYSRKHLNIRKISNFLLASSSLNDHCKSYLIKYFKSTIVLPSDWLEVADICLALRVNAGHKKCLTSTLRNMLKDKFSDFDVYQLAKYNKNKNKKKKKKETNRKSFKQKEEECNDDEEESKEENQAKNLTLKQLIRVLHINRPVEPVMAIIGKKYPKTIEEFNQSNLPGFFDKKMAGKRMKLPIPETWETQIPLRGNTAKVWQDLIDHKKLPFMAMLRNIRNLILSGISSKHHNIVLNRLSNKESVINSKQLAFSFLNAFTVLDDMIKIKNDIEEDEKEKKSKPKTKVVRSTRRFKAKDEKKELPKLSMKKVKQFKALDERTVSRYRDSLNTAVMFSAMYNTTPIKGNSIIFLDFTDPKYAKLKCDNKAYGSIKTVGSVSSLLSLMCEKACEVSRLVVVRNHDIVDFHTSSQILKDVEKLNKFLNKFDPDYTGIPDSEISSAFNELIIREEKIDNVIFFSNNENSILYNWLSVLIIKYNKLSQYRTNNYKINVKKSHSQVTGNFSEMWTCINGCSDQVLKFIAENGDSTQLKYIDNIDKVHNLTNTAYINKLLAKRQSLLRTAIQPVLPVSKTPRWTTCRVFISSTFLDMFSERDLLVRYIFEELRRRGKEVMIDVVEVDLRWGVTEEQSKKNDTLELCLTEVIKSEFFVGMLGERYGREVEDYSGLENVEGLHWLTSYPLGASLTELEFQQCFQSIDFRRKAFFFLRDPAFIHSIPMEHRGQFVDRGRKKLNSLKNKVRSSGAQVFENYPCKWGGVAQSGQPIVTGLEEFGKRVLDCLWTSIIQSRKSHLKNIESLDKGEMQGRREFNDSWVERLQRRFQGRKKLLNQCVLAITQHYTGLLLLTGKSGSGKSTLMASIVGFWNKEHRVHESRVVVHFVGAHHGSSDTVGMLRYLCTEVENDFNYTPPYNYKDLCKELLQTLTRHSSKDERRLIIFIDGLDQLLEDVSWVPDVLPQNVLIVASTTNDSRSHNYLRKRMSLVQTIEVRSLEISDKMDLVRSVFKSHAKKLDERAFNNQMRTLVQKRDATSPLYLNLACEEIKKFGHFEKLADKLSQLPGTLVRLVTERLEHAEMEHGKDFVRVVLFALHCSFDGLTIEQLSSVLNTWTSCGLSLEDIENFSTINTNISSLLHQPSHPHLSNRVMILLQSIRSLLKPTCKEQGEKISLDRSILEDIIAHKYTTSRLGDRTYKSMHLLLAHMFWARADPQCDGSWCPPDHEALLLLPFHLLKAQAWQSWFNLMTDWKFLKSRLMAGQVNDVIQEFALKDVDVTKKGLKEMIKEERFLAFKAFLLKNCDILSKHPHLFMQQALLSNINIESSSNNIPAGKNNLCTSLQPIDPSTTLPLRQYFKWINRDQFTDHCIYTIDSVQQVALCMSLNRDESLLAVGFDDDVVRIFCMLSFQMTKMLIGHTNDITAITFIDNNRLLTASKDTTLSLWNVTDACRIAVMEKHTAPVSSCVSTMAGRLIVSVGFDGQAVVWHGVTGAFEEVLYRATRPLNCVALDPEEKFVVTGDWSGNLRMFNMLERKDEGSFIGHSCSITCVAFDQSGDFMTSADIRGQIRTWNLTMKQTATIFESNREPINCLSISSRTLYTASQNSLIQVCSATAGKCLNNVEGFEDEGVQTKATCVALNSFSDDCDVITGYHNGCIKRHSLLLGSTKWTKNLAPTPIPITAITLFVFREHKWLVVGKSDGDVVRLDIDSGKHMVTFVTENAKVTSLNFMHDHLISTSEEGSIFIFQLSKLPLNATKVTADWHVWPHEGCVAGLVVNPLFNRYISVGHDMKLILWELPVKRLYVVDNAHLDWVTCCDWADDGADWNFMVTGSLDFGLKTWVMNGDVVEHQTNLDGHMASISAVKCTKSHIVSTSTNGEIRLWSYMGFLITTVHNSLQRINGLDLFPTQNDEEYCYKTFQYYTERLTSEEDLTGVFMVTCTDDGCTQLWKPFANDEKGTLIGHEGAVRCLEVGKQGLVCSGGEDKQVKVWKWAESSKITGNAVEILPQNHTHFIVVLRNGELMLWKEEKHGWLFNKIRVCNEQILAAVTVRESLILVSTTLRRLLLLSVVKTKEHYNVVVLWEKKITEEATSLSVSPSQSKDGSVVASGHLSGIVIMWIVKEHSILCNGEIDLKDEMPKGQPKVLVASKFIGEELMLLGPQGYLTMHSLQCSSSRISLTKIFNWEMSEWGCCIEEGEGHLFVGDLAGKVWAFKTNKIDSQPALIFQAHDRKVTCMLLVGRLLFTASEDKQIKVWCLSTNKQVGQLSCPLGLTCMKLLDGDQSCDEVSIACASKAASVFVFNWVF